MTNTTTTGGLSSSRDALDEDDYAPTRWENLKWAVTYTRPDGASSALLSVCGCSGSGWPATSR